jgi:uncharacterized protein (DUF1778 family)
MAILNPQSKFLGRIDLRRHNSYLELIRSFPEPGIRDHVLTAARNEATDTLASQMKLELRGVK